MSRKKATLLTISFLASLGKVCSSHHHQLLHFSKTFAFLNNLSTLAADESIDSHDFSNGYGGQEICGEFCSGYQRPGGFEGVYGENLNTSANYQNSYENSQHYTEAPPRSFGGGHGMDYTAENQRWINGQSGGSVNFHGGGVNRGCLSMDSSKGSVDGQISRGYQMANGAFFDVGNSSGANNVSLDFFQNGGSVVNNSRQGERDANMRKFSRFNSHGEDGRMCSQNQGNYGMGSAGVYQRGLGSNMGYLNNPSHLSSLESGHYGGNQHYGGNMGQMGPNLNNHYTGNDRIKAQGSVVYNSWNGETHQHSTGYSHMGNATPPQQFFGNNQSGSNGFYQQNSSSHCMGSTGMYLPSPCGHQSVNVGDSWSNEPQNTVTASQALGSIAPEGESTNNNLTQGTLEEFDAFCKDGKVKEAVEILELLKKRGTFVDSPRYLTLMKVCGDEKALEEAKVVHDHLLQSMSPLKTSTYNRIIEMYARCGSMDDACDVFNKMPKRNLTTWDTMITWYSRNGLGEVAIDLFTRFKEAGLKPDGQMFIGIFNACVAVGDINEGILHFVSMSKDYGIVPSMKHYVGIVDMLGSTGYLDEALEFIEKMPVEPSIDVWETLMSLCRVHGNLELGDRCAQIVEQMDPSHLSKESKDGLVPVKASDFAREKKKSAQNSLEIKSRVHEYRAGDRSHPENDKIYALLRGMKEQMKEAGYIPETRFVLHDIDLEGKEEALMAHSERLAVAYGLMTSSVRSPIRVIKNLRVCVDCHNALKIISKLVGRELIMRDAKRFHHMKDGKCSCNDYW